jgi:hypothetical protein
MEIFTGQSSFSREAREKTGERQSDGLFLWVLVILVLIGLNAFAWAFCMYVFGNPEVPFNYKLLTHPKIDRLEPLKNYSPVNAPRGKFLTAKDFYADQYRIKEKSLAGYNAILKRNFLQSYVGVSTSDTRFMRGSFKVEGVTLLSADDVFPSGIAVRARSEDFPAALLDYVLPSESVPANTWQIGDILEIEQSSTCAALVHIERLTEDEVCFTVVPIVEGQHQTPGGGAVNSKLPERINLTGSWPLSKTGVSSLPAPPDAPKDPIKAKPVEAAAVTSE